MDLRRLVGQNVRRVRQKKALTRATERSGIPDAEGGTGRARRQNFEYVWLVLVGLTGGCHVRIAVMAAGAVGGYFGGRMAAAGHDVAFIARGAHGDAIRRNGLKIESPLGDLYLKNVEVTADPKQIGTVDVVLFAVKLWDTEAAGEQTRALVGSKTRTITLQNGVDSVERLAPILGNDATIGGATYIVAKIARPGVILHTGANAKVLCGRLDPPSRFVTRRLRRANQGCQYRHPANGSYDPRSMEEVCA